MHYCFVRGCATGNRKKVSIFLAPKDPILLEKWRKLIPRKDRQLCPTDRVCELHFQPDMILRSYKHIINGEEVHTPRGKPILTPDALPTLFPNLPSYLSSNVKKLKAPKDRSSTFIETRMSLHYGKKCIDPFRAHKRPILKSLVKISNTLSKRYNLPVGGKVLFICRNCLKKIAIQKGLNTEPCEYNVQERKSGGFGTPNEVASEDQRSKTFNSESTHQKGCNLNGTSCSHYIGLIEERAKNHQLQRKIEKMSEEIMNLRSHVTNLEEESEKLKREVGWDHILVKEEVIKEEYEEIDEIT